MIRFEGVVKTYEDLRALDGLDLEIHERELCALVGPSGAGKSTALRMVNRLVEPSSGRILLDGRDVRSMSVEGLRRGIGYVIQGVGLFPHLSVADNVAVVPELLKWERRRVAARVEEMLALVGLEPGRYASRYPAELSGGEAQRVGVARALASDPPVLLMDEPFSAVDPLARQRLQNEFLAIQRRLRKTVVMVTHDVDEAIRMGDRIALLRAGRLVQFDRPEALLEAPRDAFVAGFLGADRALKRLSRLPVRRAMRPSSSIGLEEARRLAACEEEGRGRGKTARPLWVLDGAGRPLGRLDPLLSSCEDELEALLAAQGLGELALDPEASLRDALSSMLGSGSRCLPVVDERGHLIGELGLADLEAASEGPGPERADHEA